MKRKAKTVFTSVLSLLLTVVMVAGIAPIGAFAQGADITNDKSESETELSASTPLGKIVNSQLADAQDNTDYYIANVEMQGNTATVSFENLEQCNLILAAYDEETLQMLTYSETPVEALQKTADVTVDGELPEHYFVKAFLVDANHAALCKEYVCMQNTTAYEEFLAKTPEDYEGKEIVEFDEEQEDFGVLNDDVVIAENSAEMTYTYDETTLTYVFSNANEEVKALKPGDVFYYEYGSGLNEFLLFKVKTIDITDSTVKIVEDEDIGLEEAFDFVRIDEESEASDAQVDDSELGEAFTPAASMKKTRAASESATESFSTKLNIKYTKNEQNSVSGSVALKVTVSAKLYYDVKLFGKDYYEFKSEISVKMNITVSFEGSLQVDKDKFCIPFLPIPVGPFVIEAKVYLIAEFSSSLEFEGSLETKITVTADSDNSIKKSVITKNEPGFEVSNKIQLRLGLGVEVKLSLAKIISLAANGEGGLKFSGTPSTVGVWLDKHHDCITCISGKVDFFYGVGLSLKITIIPNVFSFSWTIAKYEKSYFVCDRYFSYSADGFSCGEGTCPNIEYKVTFTVTDKNGNPVKDVYVSASDGVCDSDADGKYDETYMYTGEDGKAVFYFKKGEHTIELKADSYDKQNYSFKVISNSRAFNVTLGGKIVAEDEEYKVVFTAKDKSGTPIEGVRVSATDGVCDYDADGKYDETYMYTGKDGKAVFYFKQGEHTVELTSDLYEDKNFSFKVISSSCEFNVPLNEKVVAEGVSGENVKWIIYKSGVMRISGKGDMENYAYYYEGDNLTDSPWYQYRYDINTVIIENGVTSIGGCAFCDCIYLTSVVIPDSVISIGPHAFEKCSSLESVTIPESVAVICENAFERCEDLTSVKIPNSVIDIGNCAFRGCSSLISVSIPSSVTRICAGVFWECHSLTSVTIPDSVTSIDDYAFNNSGLTSVTIPDSVTSIGRSAFYYCDSLTSVTIPDSVTSIGEGAFGSCTGLTSVTIPGSVASIENNTFRACTGLTSVTISYGTTSIGSAFFECNSLTSVTIPNSVTSIGNSAFDGCSSLTSVTIPDSVTSIGDYAFADCSSLTSIAIPNGVTNIGDLAFFGCHKLTNIIVDAENEYYSSVDGVLFNKDKTELIQYPVSNARTSYIIPDGVMSIGKGALIGCSSLTSVTIPDSVESIGDYAFSDCGSLTSIVIPNGVTNIGDLAFFGCRKLTNIIVDAENEYYSSVDGVLFNKDKTELIQYPIGHARANYIIPDGVRSISGMAFALLSSLTSVTIPDSVTSIGDYAFYCCDGLTDVYYGGTQEQWKAILIGSDNSDLTKATIHYNGSDAQAATLRAAAVMSVPKAVNVVHETAVLRGKVVCSGAEAGELYMLYAYVGDMDFKYIDQSVADAGGSVTFNYYPMDCDEELTVKVVGKFNGEIQEKSIEPQAQSVSSVALSEDYIELNVGAEHMLKAVLEPLYATNRSVTWSSSDENIVTVDEKGVVTAVAPGEAEITVTTADGGFTDSCHVRVYQPVQSIEITCGDIEVKKGKTAEVTWLLKTANATDYECVWSSSDESVATVDERGIVTGVKKGEATVTLTVINHDGSTVSDSVNVTVKGSFFDTLLSILLTPVKLIVDLFKLIIGLFK